MPKSQFLKLEEKIDNVNAKIDAHLMEASGVKEDLAFLKKGFWVLGSALVTGAGSLVLLLVKQLMTK